MNRDQITRHDLLAEDLASQATMSGLLDVPEERNQISLLDVERRAQSLLRERDVGLGEAHTKFGWRVGRAVTRHGERGDVRVAASGQCVEDQSNAHEQQRVEQ